MKKLSIILGASLIALAGCGGGTKSDNGATILAQGNHSSVKEQAVQDIHDQAAFEKLWKDAYASQSTPPALPTVDFTKETVVALFLGEKQNSGFDLRVKSAAPAENGKDYDVTFLVIVPGDHCARGGADKSTPFLIGTVPSAGGTVNFDTETRHNPPCGN